MVDSSQLREHMQVVGSDGEPVGRVDRIEGDVIKLTKNDAGHHHHHRIPLASVSTVEGDTVRLSQTAAQAKEHWHDLNPSSDNANM